MEKDNNANMATRYEHEIPEGYEARIEGNKVIIELKEDVEEKIRKSIVDFIWQIAIGAFNRGSMPSAVQCQEWLSYLERQKDKRELDFAEGKVEGVKQTCQEIKDAMSLFEPKDLTPFEFTFRDYIDSAIRYCLSGEGYQQYIKEWAADLLNLEKQKEQKPAEKQDYSGLTDFERAIHRGFLCAGVENVPVTIIKETAQDCLAQIKPAEWSDSVAKEMFIKALERAVEQTKKGYELTDCDKHSWWEDFKAYSGIKPAEWSEMEEKDIQEASDYLRDYANKYVQGGNSKLYLQSLADRIESLCPQLKYEWSEEDEEWYMYLLGELNASIKDYCGAAEKDIKEAIRWFKSRYKSLRPQPHWKPSKEQMQALKKIIEYCRPIHNNSISGWDAFSGLCSLYNDLNKL